LQKGLGLRGATLLILWLLLLLSNAVAQVRAADETLFDQFLGSPLIVLAALFVIAVVAFAYRRIRK
jgi:cadmium resistance protein CadD (predicted permease)